MSKINSENSKCDGCGTGKLPEGKTTCSTGTGCNSCEDCICSNCHRCKFKHCSCDSYSSDNAEESNGK